MKFLITGGAGFIGSTIASALEDEGHTPVIIDSLITGKKEFTRNRIFYQEDIGDTAALERIFREHPDIYATVHCAALIIVLLKDWFHIDPNQVQTRRPDVSLTQVIAILTVISLLHAYANGEGERPT